MLSGAKKKPTEYFHNVQLFMVEISTEYYSFSDTKTIYSDFLKISPKIFGLVTNISYLCNVKHPS